MQFTQDSAMHSRDIENRYIQDRTAPVPRSVMQLLPAMKQPATPLPKTRRRSHPAIAPAKQKAPKGPTSQQFVHTQRPTSP